jgi:3-hydroxybutyryl-CoA dehydrogenase
MSEEQPEIKTIAVIGAGAMGHGIAHVAALGGFRTLLHDADQDALARGRKSIAANLDKGVARGKLDASDAEAALARLETVGDLEQAAREADFVIEAVPERMRLKIEIFQTLDRAAPEHAVLATNTSGLSITELAAVTRRPGRVPGMHFFNPVHIMKLVEIVRGLETDEEVLELTAAVAQRMGKQTVVVRESPGFVTSRVNALIGNEAFEMLDGGIASAEDIDQALKLGLNHPMGPFELVDLVGLDVRLSVLKNLHATLGEKYRPSPLLEKFVKAGRLGRKVGRGVYEYDEQGKRL